MKKNLLLLTFSVLFALLLLEAALGFGTRAGVFPIKIPSYSLAAARTLQFSRDSNPDFGVWHEPNASTRHTLSCIDLIYRSNSYGARDVERALQSPRPRVLVLGDSMIEGFGVPDEHRLSNLLERDTGIEHLNFGVTGGFGTTQYYLLYKTLASRFSHAAVIIGLLPDNDFWDNDYEYGKQVYPDRYRPYLVGEYPSYRLVYHQSSLEQGASSGRAGWLGFAQRILSELTYSYNALAYFKQLVMIRLYPYLTQSHSERLEGFFTASGHPLDPSRPYSGYHDYRKDQLDLVKYTFEQIRQVAAGKHVIIVVLPTKADFQRYDPTAGTPLGAELERFAAAIGMGFVDLLPDMHRRIREWDGYFLPCDQHWSAEANAVAAALLRDELAPLYRDLTQ